MPVRETKLHARGLAVEFHGASLHFRFGEGVFGPAPELRSLDAIRASLRDPHSSGPDPVYGICMDIGRCEHREELERRHLLFGAVGYAAGQLGEEPVRSQGHVHALAPHSGWSPPELFETWHGRAIVYMQENSCDDPGRCFAVLAGPGEHVIVPPGWPHFVANADPSTEMAFVALCDREYGFVYDGVRARGGLAWFPVFEHDTLRWKANSAYAASTLEVGTPREYLEFRVQRGVPLYTQFAANPDALQWVSEPVQMMERWAGFNPLGIVSEFYDSRES